MSLKIRLVAPRTDAEVNIASNPFFTRRPKSVDYSSRRSSNQVGVPGSGHDDEFIHLVQRENDQAYINKLAQSVSSLSLAKRINEIQKKATSETPYRKMQQPRIAHIQEENRMRFWVKQLAQPKISSDKEYLYKLADSHKCVRQTLAKIIYQPKDAQGYSQSETLLFQDEFIRKHLKKVRKSQRLEYQAEKVREKFKNGRKDHFENNLGFFRITKDHVRDPHRQEGEEASNFYKKIQERYGQQLKSNGDITRMPSRELIKPVLTHRSRSHQFQRSTSHGRL